MITTVTNNSLLNGFNENYNYCSWFNKISSCLMKEKLEEILKDSLDEHDSERVIGKFREELKVIRNYRISNIEKYKRIIIEYANIWCGSKKIANDFINHVADGSLYSFFKVKYIGRKRIRRQEGNNFPNNLIFDFDFDIFLNLTSRFEEMHEYETSYRHYFMLIYLLELIESVGVSISTFDKRFYKKFFPVLHNNINSMVLTGMVAFAEFDLGYPYVALFDELRKLIPETRKIFTYNVTPDNLSFTCKIKNYSVITKKFAKYLGNAPTDEDKGKTVIRMGRKYKLKDNDIIHILESRELDTASYSELRIVEGSTSDRIKVFVKLSGQRIINRLFSINGNVTRNLKTHKLHEYIYMSDNFVAFTLWVVLASTKESQNNFKDVERSKILPYIQFVKEEAKHRQRGIVSTTATAILLSKMGRREWKTYIRNKFNNNATRQRAFISRSVAKISRLKEKTKEPLVSILVKELKNGYKW